MNICEKVAYLKGLMEGLTIDVESKEGKLFAAIVDVLEDMAYEIEDLGENALDIGDELDAISADLEDVENEVFGCDCDDDDCCCCDDDDDDCCCCDCDEEDYVYEVNCPACGADVIAEESDLMNGEMDCPACGEHLEFDFEEIEEDDEEEDD